MILRSLLKETSVEFTDKWDSIKDYIDYLSVRIKEMYRLLSNTGVFCLHLDYRSIHYAKVEMDKIFGYNNFLNEIIWHYKTFQGNVNNIFLKNTIQF